MIPLADSEGPDQTAHPRSLIWAFVARIRPDTFRMARRIRWGNLVVHICCVVRACTISKSLFESAVILIKISEDHILIEVLFFYLSEKVRLSVSRLKRNCNPCFLCIMKTCLFKYIANSTTKNWKFSDKKFWYFSYFCSKHRGGSNEYPQSMFWAEIRK